MTFPELIHGKKPEVAPFLPTDPLEELRKLLSGEIKDWPQITELSNLFQTYMMGALDKAIPGFSDILKTGGEDTQAILDSAQPLIQGEVPEDVAKQVFRTAAFQSLGAGTLGGPMGSALAARNLGLTSLDLMKQGTDMATAGTNAAQRWQQIAMGTILDPSKQLYSPEWFSTFMAGQRAAKQATKQFKNNVDAAPDPVVSGISGTIMNLLGAYLGAGRGGGGGNTLATTGASSWGGNVAQGTGAVNVNIDPQYGGFNAPASDYKNVVEPLPLSGNQSYFNQAYGYG